MIFLKNTFFQACEKMGCQLLEFNGEVDHVHLLIQYPPKHSVSVIVNALKAASSRRLRSEFADLKRFSNLWSRSYFAASVGGAPIEVLKQYIENQNNPTQ